MAIINTNGSFGSSDTVTNTTLNSVADAATFNDPVDETTLELITTGADSGKLRVKDNGVGTTQIAASSVTFSKLDDVIDDDTMATASDTTLATSESIKAYVDELIDEYALKEPTSGKTGTFNVTTGWQDLDLSTAVGANKAMVIMEVYGGSAGTSTLFKTKGSVIDRFNNASDAGWGASGLVPATLDRGGVITIVTDASGIIEYEGAAATSGVSYNILAYQKLL